MQSFIAFKINRVRSKSSKKLVSVLSRHLSQIFFLVSSNHSPKPNSISSVIRNSSECVQKMTSFRIQVVQKTLAQVLAKNLQQAFTCLKFFSSSSSNIDMEGSIPGGTFQTSSQARSVLMKSENLCRRVSSLVDKIGSQFGSQIGSQIGSQDSCESLSSRINLHIPRGSLTNTPLSPISMGELDTDRISSKVEDVEAQIVQYDLVLKVWKSWKNWAGKRIYSRQNKAMAEDFVRRKVLRKIFLSFKEKFVRKVKSMKKVVLAQGSYVQKRLRKGLLGFKKWVGRSREEKERIKSIQGKKLKKIVKAWKNVAKELSKTGKKLREYKKKWNKKVLLKHFKYFLIISMILHRENKQKAIASAFNRERMLKLGFQHFSLSILTNKYYNSLNTLSSNHYEKTLKKTHFDLFYLNTLTQKRIRVVKSTGLRLFRKNNLIKAMRKLYSFCSQSKKFRQKSKNSKNYYISNLYLKTLVSWQSYHKTSKLKNKIIQKSKDFFKKNYTGRFFFAWKKIYPKFKNLRIIAEGVEAERKYWVMKEFLLEWVVKTKKQIEKRFVFENKKNLRMVKKIFCRFREYSERRIEKTERIYKKCECLGKKILKRLFAGWKKWVSGRGGIRKKAEKLKKLRTEKTYKKWRILFLRKITLTPLVLKRQFLFIWRRWKKFVSSTSRAFKQTKRANFHNTKRLKDKIFKRWKLFLYNTQQNNRILIHCNQKRKEKLTEIVVNVWKSFTLCSRVKNLKLAKAKNHCEYMQKFSIFTILKKFQENQEDLIEKLSSTWKSSIINRNKIRPKTISGDLEQSQSLGDLEKLFLKSKGISRWFTSIRKNKNKSNDISSILSNSLRIEVSENFFSKQAVEAIQTRRQKAVKKILAYWRLFVDISKRKYKNALDHYNKSLNRKLKLCYQSWKGLSLSNKNSRKLLQYARDQIKQHRTKKLLTAWKMFKSQKKIKKHRIRILTKSRLSKYLADIINYWKSYTKYKLTIEKLVKNSLSIRRSRMIFKVLAENASNSIKSQNAKAEKKFISKFFGFWTQFVTQNRKIRRQKKLLKEQAENFYYDLGCVRALRILKRHAEGRLMLKKANQIFFENAFRKVFRRWFGLHERFLKKMRLAKRIASEKLEKQKSFCIRKWFYVSHLSSWKNRAEKRLFFYWDRRLKRILFTWKHLANRKLENYEKVWQFRTLALTKKSMKALKMQNSLNSTKSEKIQQAENLQKIFFLKRGFRILEKFHQHSRQKLRKLTKALNFRYNKTCEKFFATWESFIKLTKAKKGKLKRNFSLFLRNYGLKKFELTNPQISKFFKSDLSKDLDFLQGFGKSFTNSVPKGRNYLSMGIFIKWRSLVGCKAIDSYQKSGDFYVETLKVRCFKAWTKAIVYAKSRRKTLRAAIIFHRTSLKKRVFNKWRPKKVIRRRK